MKLSRSTASILFGVGVAVILISMTVSSVDFPLRARVAPLLIGIPASIAAVAVVLRDVRGAWKGDSSVGQSDSREEDRYVESSEVAANVQTVTEEDAKTQIEGTSAVLATLWVVGFIFLIWVFGALIAAMLFTVTFMRIYARERWILCVAYSAGITTVGYVFIDRLLEQSLYPGIVGDLLPF